MGGCSNTNGSLQKKEECPDARIIMSVNQADNAKYYSPGVIVDIATMQENMSTIKLNNNININLAAINISYDNFRRIFYYQNAEFNPSVTAFTVSGETIKQYIHNNSQRVITSDGSIRAFNLFRELLRIYETKLGSPSNCWDSCSLTKFQQTIAGINTLLDVGGSCCISCSLTLDEFFNSIEQQGVELSGNLFPRDLNYAVPKDTTKTPIAVVTAEFVSSTPQVPNVNIVWPFAVDFSGVVQRYHDNS